MDTYTFGDLRDVEIIFKVSIMETVTVFPQYLPWGHYQRQNTGLESLNLAPYDISAAAGSWLTSKSVEL